MNLGKRQPGDVRCAFMFNFVVSMSCSFLLLIFYNKLNKWIPLQLNKTNANKINVWGGRKENREHKIKIKIKKSYANCLEKSNLCKLIELEVNPSST